MIGTDIIEVSRIEKLIKKNSDNFLNKVFTDKEQHYCMQKNKTKYQSFAARYAAKEAVAKLLATGISGFWFTDIEIINDDSGKPNVFLYNNAKKLMDLKQIKNIEISLSHSKEYAIAVAIAN